MRTALFLVKTPAILSWFSDDFMSFLSFSGQHFNRLHEKYGTPVHVVNLVKRKEKYKSRHEAILAEMLEYQVLRDE